MAADGTSILVRSGTYRENVDFLGKSIEVKGWSPDAPDERTWPVIEGAADEPVVSFTDAEDPNCLLLGFVLSKGKGRLAGGICCSRSCPTIAHCVIVGNRATDLKGAAVYCTDSTVTLVNCTIADNYAGAYGAALYLVNSRMTAVNSILWGNAPSEIQSDGIGVSLLYYSDIAGGWPGVDNLGIDPLFASRGYWVAQYNPDVVVGPDNPGAVWIAGDYHLQSQAGRWDPKAGGWVRDAATSPCIHAGDPTGSADQEPPPNGGIINMGAYGGTAEASKSDVQEPDPGKQP